MRIVTGLFAVLCGAIVIVIAARYGFKTSDNDFDGYIWAVVYGAVSFGGLFGHGLGVRVFRHSKAAGLLIFAGSVIALTISLSNSLGAMAGRGDEAQAKRLQVAETARNIKRGLERAQSEREGLRFTPVDATALAAAKSKADAAAGTRLAECAKRGDRCRDREADEKKALDDLDLAARNKALADRANALDAEIASQKAKLDKAGPVLEANSQGLVFARLFDLPESKAAFLSAWQNFAMAVTVEMLIVLSIIAFEVLSHAETKIASSAASGPAQASEILAPDPEPRMSAPALPASAKPRLIASSEQPAGNVYTIMADLLLPGKAKDRVELTAAHQAYVRICRNQAKRPVSPETFVKAMERLCKEGGIPLKSMGKGVYLMSVRLKDMGEETRALS